MGKKQNTVIVIAGPTASGKTAVALQLAKHFNTEIISCDSRQCYKELNIGVARPSVEELQEVKHHFIASHSVTEDINAAFFESYALEKAKDIFQKNKVVVMVGGTGLYIKAFCEGLDAIPSIDSNLRNKIIHHYEKKGIGWLQEELQQKDPWFAKEGEMKNPQRMMRALEVMEATGKSIFDFRKWEKRERDFNIIKIGLEMERAVLYDRINQRVDSMIKNGLLEEVRSLVTYRNMSALQTVGYRELFDYLAQHTSFEKATGLIKQNTRNYAKRQLTWFRRDKDMQWFSPRAIGDMLTVIAKILSAGI